VNTQSDEVRVVACPHCSTRAFTWGPGGEPERRCHGCGFVWTPTPGHARGGLLASPAPALSVHRENPDG
jgi:hypothetical protein